MDLKPIIRYADQTQAVSCPYGNVKRIITGGEGAANVHIVSVTKGSEHFHRAYEETYFFLSGDGTITLGGKTYPIRPETIMHIPAGLVHSLESNTQAPLTFIIFGTPPMSIEDDQAKPVKP